MAENGPLSPGSTLQGGKYIIEELLGQGGFGITYRATDTLLGRPVAIKELYPDGSQRDDVRVTVPLTYTEGRWGKMVSDFLREARTLASLDHPGIVMVHDYFEENNTAYMVMKFAEGVDMVRLMVQRGGRLPEDEALRYTAEVGQALAALHARGLLHRDIKPSNIIVTRQGHAVLIDFGAAREFQTDKAITHTVIASFGFAPPEQFHSRAVRGPAADIYSLAATCYYLLTGSLPTPEMGEGEQLRPQVRAALEHALAYAPELRPQNVATFLGELEGRITPPPPPPTTPPLLTEPTAMFNDPALIRDKPNSAPIPTQVLPPPPLPSNAVPPPYSSAPPQPAMPAQPESQRARWPIAVLGLAVLTLFTVGAILLLGNRNTPEPVASNLAASPTAAPLAAVLPASPTAPLVSEAPPTDTVEVVSSAAQVSPTDETTAAPTQAAVTIDASDYLSVTLVSVSMSSATDGWAVGVYRTDTNDTTAGPAVMLHYNGDKWQRLATPPDWPRLNTVQMLSADEGWAVGGHYTPEDKGIILHYHDGTWQPVSDIAAAELHTLNGMSFANKDSGWAVGGGQIAHYHDGKWALDELPSYDVGFNGAFALSGSEAWAVGMSSAGNAAVTMHYFGGKWQVVDTGVRGELRTVYMAAPNDGWAAGQAASNDGEKIVGFFLHYDGRKWTPMPSYAEDAIYAIEMLSPSEGWAVGGYGAGLQNYTNGAWQAVHKEISLYGLDMISADEGWAVGGTDTSALILHYQNGGWNDALEPVPTEETATASPTP